VKELELFEYLRDNHFPDLIKSSGTYDIFDCISQEAGIYAELKSRRTHYDDLLIEKKKWDNLILHSDALQLRPWYINSTPQGIYAFNLGARAVPVWEHRSMPITTDFANKQKTLKIVGILNISEAIRIADLSL